MSGDVALVAAVIIGFALVSERLRYTVISAPMVFAAVGLLTGPEIADVIDLGLELESVELIGEATLGVLLFADASRIRTSKLRHEFMLPLRLLGIGLPLTFGLTTVILYFLVDGIDWYMAALVGAILTPTDAALGQQVVTDEGVPARIRQGLTVESGLNDGLIVPVVVLFTALSLGDDAADVGSADQTAGFWVGFALERLGLGIAAGLVVGAIGAVVLTRARRAGWVDGLYAQLATFALAIGTLATAIHFEGNGFIACFVAGLLFGRFADDAEHLGEFTEDAAQLATAVSFFLFGNVLLGPAVADLDAVVILCAFAVLTVGRMLPVAIAMIGTGAAAPTVAFVGWFGPRGLASILFGLLLLEEAGHGGEGSGSGPFAVVAWTVALSIVLHGATAAVGARRYGSWWREMSDDERDSMPEGVEVIEQRQRM